MVIDQNIRYFFNITVRPVDGKDESHNHADDKRQTREADGRVEVRERMSGRCTDPSISCDNIALTDGPVL